MHGHAPAYECKGSSRCGQVYARHMRHVAAAAAATSTGRSPPRKWYGVAAGTTRSLSCSCGTSVVLCGEIEVVVIQQYWWMSQVQQLGKQCSSRQSASLARL